MSMTKDQLIQHLTSSEQLTANESIAEELARELVDKYIGLFGSVQEFLERYKGWFENNEEFCRSVLGEDCDSGSNLNTWLVVDWDATYDYIMQQHHVIELSNGDQYYFNQ